MKRYLLPILFLLIAATSLKAQYCTTNLYYSGCSSNYIQSFSTSGGIATISSLTTGCSGTQSYIYYANQTHVATAGSSVFFKIVNNPMNEQNYKVWVDWNNNGNFTDPGEQVYSGLILWGDSVSGSFVIPSTVSLGTKRMRVRCNYYNSSFTACSNESMGEAEDYNISVVSSTPCSSAPLAGIAVASQSSVCANNAFSVSLNGYTVTAGTSIQWQSRLTSSSTWANITGATNTMHYIASQTAASDYRAFVSCGTASDTSSIITVAQNPFTQCYCSPTNGTPLVSYPSNYITNVTIPTTTLNHSSSSTTAGGYTLVSPATATGTCTLIPGETYSFSANISSWSAPSMAIWLDYNQNGSFETSEKISVTVSSNNTASASFTVPYTSLSGVTGMRVTASSNTITGACTPMYQGEVEDYTVTIMALPACSGTPTAGLATAPSIVCANTSFSLSVIGSSVASGLSFQWQSRPATSTTWTDITGATTKTFSVSGQTTATNYRLIVSCGSNSDTSTTATVNQNLITQCYCSPTNGTNLVTYAYNYLTNVSIPGTTLNASSSSVATNGYTLVPSTPASNTATLNPGEFYSFTTALAPNVYSVGLWIDYNQNGTFETTEKIPVTVNTSTATGTASFMVPATATVGITGMRVSAAQGTISLPCGNLYNGEVEDYTVNIVALPACSGTPAAGTATASVSTICPNISFTLSLSGSSAFSGLSYQWQAKPASATSWTDISGATTKNYIINNQTVTTEYRAIVMCSISSDISTAVTVTQNPLAQCYCSPNTGATLVSNSSNLITNVSLLGTTLSASSTIAPSNGYSLVPATPASNTASLVPGHSYIFSATIASTTLGSSLWIDYNQNGIFDFSENINLITNSTNSQATAAFTVPLNALTGTTGMRVAASENNWVFSPCSSVGNGEVEDYSIAITSASPCSGTPTAGTAAATKASVCANMAFVLYLNGTTTASGLTYQWQSKPASSTTWTNIVGGTTKYHNVNSQSAASDYRAIVSCSGNHDTSVSVSVSQNPFSDCYCGPTNGFPLVYYGYNYITNVTIPTTTLNASSWSTTNGYTIVPPTPSFNTASLNPGDNYTFNASVGSNVGSMSIWIDYNQSGTFDPSERTNLTINFATNTATGNFTVPSNAIPGATGMRATASSSSGTLNDPCAQLWDAEVEDYILSIVALPACSGTPAPGAATATSTSVCINKPFTLSLSGSSALSGLSYQWQSRPSASGSWTNITGATSKNYTINSQSASTEYRAVVTCSGSSDTSSPVTVMQNSFTQCYCSPNTGVNLVNYSSNYITNVTILGTSLNASSFSTPANGYSNLPPTTSYNTATLTGGQTYTFNASAYSWGAVALWIDYNHNGTFDTYEKIPLTSTSSNIWAATFTIPTTALAGATGMRVAASDYSIYAPCDVIYYGEVEDYTITVNASCSVPVLQTPSIASSTSAIFNWNAVSSATNYEYVIDQSGATPSGAGIVINSLTHTENSLIPGSTYYFHLRSNCGNNDYSSWSTQSFTTWPTNVPSVNGSTSAIEVYPNPATDKITVRLANSSEEAVISLTDLNGKLLKTLTAVRTETVIDISSLLPGIYLLRYNSSRYSETIKFNKL